MARQGRGLRLLDKIDTRDIDGVKQILNGDVDLTVDRKGDTPIHLAARKGYLDILQLLVESGCNVNQKNMNGFAALHYAAREGSMDIVNFLLKCGALPNIQNTDGDAPIHELVKYQPMDTIEEMITLGMDVNLQNKMGCTPLHVAAANNRQEAIEALLTCGANSSIKDKHGRTASEVCKNPEIVNVMKLHSLTLDAMKKGIVKAQGISVSRQKVKKRLHLKRVGVVIEKISMTTDVKGSFYLRREKSENSSYSFCTDKGDELLSDVFFIKITNVPTICEVTLTLPIYGMPTAKEELFVRFDTGAKLTVTTKRSTEEGKSCTFATKLTPDCFSVCALFTCTKTEIHQVGMEGGVVTTGVDKEMKLKIPPDTFNEETNISIQVFPAESTAKRSLDTILTDVYNIHADKITNNNKMTLIVPLHQQADNTENIALVTAEEMTDDSDENCLSVVDTEPRIENNTLVYEIPHFSIHVAVAKWEFNKNKKDIYDRLVRVTERQRSAVFFAVVRYEEGASPIIVVECSGAEKSSKRIEKWIAKGYTSQSPEQSGIFLLSPYQEFSVSFQGVPPDETIDKRKLAFIPRRASFQPYRIPVDMNAQACKEGSILIYKTHNVQQKAGNGELITVLPFNIIRKESEKDSTVSEGGSQRSTSDFEGNATFTHQEKADQFHFNETEKETPKSSFESPQKNDAEQSESKSEPDSKNEPEPVKTDNEEHVKKGSTACEIDIILENDGVSEQMDDRVRADNPEEPYVEAETEEALRTPGEVTCMFWDVLQDNIDKLVE